MAPGILAPTATPTCKSSLLRFAEIEDDCEDIVQEALVNLLGLFFAAETVGERLRNGEDPLLICRSVARAWAEFDAGLGSEPYPRAIRILVDGVERMRREACGLQNAAGLPL